MERLSSSFPALEEPVLGKEVRTDRFLFNSGEISLTDIDMCFSIVEAAKIVFAKYCESNEKTGAVFAITKRDPNAPILLIQIGEVTYPDDAFIGGKLTKYVDYAKNKARFLQLHPEFTKSSQNAELPANERLLTQIGKKEVVGGAVAFGDWILSASGISSEAIVDENAIESVWRVAQVKKAYSKVRPSSK